MSDPCRGLAVAVLIGLLGLVPSVTMACAACGNPSLPQRPSGTGRVDGGTGGIAVSLQSTTLRVSHPAGCADLTSCDATPVQPAHSHELFVVPAELSLLGHWAFNASVGVEAVLPLRMVWMNAHYETPSGADYEPIDVGVHHRDEALLGVGDGEVRVRATAPLGRWWGAARLGVTVPLGSTEPDPFAAGDRGEAHQHVQFGTGTFNPTVGLEASRGTARTQYSLYGAARGALYANRHGFRAGTSGMLGGSAGVKTVAGMLFSASCELSVEGPERWSGVIRQDGLLGRTEVRVGPDVLWRTGRAVLGASARVPVYRHLVEGDEPAGTLRSPVSLSLTAAWGLGGGARP